jgi:hypothetical protein
MESTENLVTAELTLTGNGNSYLVMNNILAADPDQPLNKEHAALVDRGRGKSNRTEVEEKRLRRIQWQRSLYLDEKQKLIFPTYNIACCLAAGAKSYRLGSTTERALTMMEADVPLKYAQEEMTLDELWESGLATWSTVVNGNPSAAKGSSKVMLTRPRLRPWSLTCTVQVDTQILDWPDFEKVVVTAGRGVGIGNARKLGHGRFTAEIEIKQNQELS